MVAGGGREGASGQRVVEVLLNDLRRRSWPEKFKIVFLGANSPRGRFVRSRETLFRVFLGHPKVSESRRSSPKLEKISGSPRFGGPSDAIFAPEVRKFRQVSSANATCGGVGATGSDRKSRVGGLGGGENLWKIRAVSSARRPLWRGGEVAGGDEDEAGRWSSAPKYGKGFEIRLGV